MLFMLLITTGTKLIPNFKSIAYVVLEIFRNVRDRRTDRAP